jgi:hypothetical protein
VCLSICLFLYPSICLSIHIVLHISFPLSTCQFIHSVINLPLSLAI